MWIYGRVHDNRFFDKNDRLLERDKLLVPTLEIEFELNPESKRLCEDARFRDRDSLVPQLNDINQLM